METIAVADIPTITDVLRSKIGAHKKNMIQVSNTKKPFFFYLNLAKRTIKQHDDIVLSALGMVIPTVIIIAEILKTNGLAMEKKVLTSTIDTKSATDGRVVHKPKIEILLGINENILGNNGSAENLKGTTEHLLENKEDIENLKSTAEFERGNKNNVGNITNNDGVVLGIIENVEKLKPDNENKENDEDGLHPKRLQLLSGNDKLVSDG